MAERFLQCLLKTSKPSDKSLVKINWLSYRSKYFIFLQIFVLLKMAQSLSPNDPSSFSRPDLATTLHLHLSLSVNFERETITGVVNLKGKKNVPDVKEMILDIKGLTIFYIYDKVTGADLKYVIGETVADIGTKLSINIENCLESFELVIGYETSPKSSGLQWLNPKQTSGKKHPFMFSQGQPTEMRSIIPCQDTPGIKVPYSADVRVPKELTALMSALRVGNHIDLPDGNRLYLFNQPVPMPTYLIAIAVGALESRRVGPRSEVWAEKEIVDKAAYEFAEAEQMLKTAESICGAYVWGIYDMLVLPPSFPYGGMENPCLTFITPTLLVGDRSLVDVIAHEISHSWTGNLVTNGNFENFWLNEGFTTFVERKIIGKMQGSRMRDLQTLVGYVELRDTITQMGDDSPLTKLVPDLKGLHPDEAFSRVPYEKGSLFLRYLEQCVGGEDKFEEFLKHYIKIFSYKSINTDDFKNLFLEYFPSKEIHEKIDWQTWLYSPGMPPKVPDLDASLMNKINSLTNQWIAFNNSNEITSITEKDISKYSTIEVLQFLNQLLEKEPLSMKTLNTLNELYKFDSNNNFETKLRWLRLCLRGGDFTKLKAALNFVNSQGRMKYLNPIYRELYKNETTRKEAIDNFYQHKDEMMLVAAKTVARIMHLSSNTL
ncbi:leukotriene A-4 hydrolase [Chrysoperla carnea]|uniref:leukotriene A-4 hydrolase n=1 Tax=Chrysoperla carnea TaxID=189513 RepID=UPI001D076771|nr:leukotriene A-4 hydrolase [Chrysoperla carnea]